MKIRTRIIELALLIAVLLALLAMPSSARTLPACPPVPGWLYGGQVDPALDLDAAVGATLAAAKPQPARRCR